MDLTALIIMLLVGLVAGLLASVVVGGVGYGILGDIVIGVLGAFIGSWSTRRVGVPFGGIAGTIFVAFIGRSCCSCSCASCGLGKSRS
jgi:uncharacterized membrane protein YeaQ/YmgE (transglycosylase-associated protein family)